MLLNCVFASGFMALVFLNTVAFFPFIPHALGLTTKYVTTVRPIIHLLRVYKFSTVH